MPKGCLGGWVQMAAQNNTTRCRFRTTDKEAELPKDRANLNNRLMNVFQSNQTGQRESGQVREWVLRGPAARETSSVVPGV